VTCSAGGYTAYHFSGGSLDDNVTATSSLPGSMEGGAGNDTLIGGDGNDALQGEDGVDTLIGNGGNDQLTPDNGTGAAHELADGGPGDDIIVAVASNGPDERYFGGPGIDRLITFGGATGTDPLAVNMAAGTLGEPSLPSQSNTISGFEDVTTSQAGDSITGDAGSNLIESSLDFFLSLGSVGVPLPPDGGDTIDPGPGVDIVTSGAGDDNIDSNDGFGDSIRCGPGNDTVHADAFDSLTDCENVTVAQTPAAAHDVQAPRCRISSGKTVAAKAFFGGFKLKVSCDEPAGLLVQAVAPLRSAGRLVTSTVGELVLAEAKVSPGSGTRTVRLRGSKRFRRSLGRSFTVRLRVEGTDSSGNRGLITKKVRVAPAKKKKRK
jgi:Ca2+-binding RTX toxin-like protein